MLSSKYLRDTAVGILSFGAVALAPSAASAEEIFPPVIQKEANMPCAPTCTLCHTTNPGNAASWPGKKFGFFMGTHGAMKGDPNSIKTAFAAYKMTLMAAGQTAQLTALEQGLDPDNGTSLCGPSYGCGASTIAKKAPPSDLSAPLWVVGAMAVAGLLRRRRHAA
jgi:hypothetical protein